MSTLYDQDCHAWTQEQAALLRAGRPAEEIDSMGRTERRELVNRFVTLLPHLLKCRVQPGRRGTICATGAACY